MERLIAAIKAMFDCTYSGHYELIYSEALNPEYVRNIDSENIRYFIEAHVDYDVSDLNHGHATVSLSVYEPVTLRENVILEVNIIYNLYEPGDNTRRVTIPDPLDIFRKIFDGLKISEYPEYRVLSIHHYKEPTNNIDTILSSTPEELELYLKLL